MFALFDHGLHFLGKRYIEVTAWRDGQRAHATFVLRARIDRTVGPNAGPDGDQRPLGHAGQLFGRIHGRHVIKQPALDIPSFASPLAPARRDGESAVRQALGQQRDNLLEAAAIVLVTAHPGEIDQRERRRADRRRVVGAHQ